MEIFQEGFRAFGSYWHHLLGAWRLRSHPNIKFLWFEDMKTDMRSTVDELSGFLDHSLDNDQISRLCEHVKFENMKENPHAKPIAGLQRRPEESFQRKGEIGDWRNYFDKERSESLNQWILEHISGTGLEEIAHFQLND